MIKCTFPEVQRILTWVPGLELKGSCWGKVHPSHRTSLCLYTRLQNGRGRGAAHLSHCPLETHPSEPCCYPPGSRAAGPRQQSVQEAEAGKGWKRGNSLWGWGTLCYKLFCFGFLVPFNFISLTLRWEWCMLQCRHSPLVTLEIIAERVTLWRQAVHDCSAWAVEWRLFPCPFLGVLETTNLFCTCWITARD